MAADNAQRPSSPQDASSIMRDASRLRAARLIFRAITIGPTVLVVGGVALFTVAQLTGHGAGAVASLRSLAQIVAALKASAIPVVIVALIGAALAFVVVKRLRQGEKTDLDMMREMGGDVPARGAALADELRADPEISILLARLETQRRAVAATVARRRWIIIPLSAVVGLVGAYKTHQMATKGSPLLSAAIVMIFAVALGLLLSERTRAGRQYSETFKQTLTPLLLRRFGAFSIKPGVVENAAPAHPAADLLPETQPGLYRIEDSIVGVFRGRPLRIDEYRMLRRDKNGRPIQGDFAAAGLLISVTSQRPWAGHVVVAEGFDAGRPLRFSLERVRLEDPVFETIYRTYASDQIVARAVLTPRMMQAMLAVTAGARLAPPLLSVDGDAVAIFAGFPSSARTFLEADAVGAAALDQIAVDLDDLAQIFAVVDMLFDTQRLHMTAADVGETAP